MRTLAGRGRGAPLRVAVFLLAACGAAPGEPPPETPGRASAGMGAGTPAPVAGEGRDAPGREDAARPMGQVTFPTGRIFHLTLAVSPEEQAWGYQERAEIGPGDGMLFVGDAPALRLFHMRNCLVPIDMIWLDGDFQVVAIEHAAPPCREEPCPSYGPMRLTRHVLEVRGGTAMEEGLQVGDRLAVVTDLPPG